MSAGKCIFNLDNAWVMRFNELPMTDFEIRIDRRTVEALQIDQTVHFEHDGTHLD